MTTIDISQVSSLEELDALEEALNKEEVNINLHLSFHYTLPVVFKSFYSKPQVCIYKRVT